MPTSLMGLSPAEINAISGRRQVAETGQMQEISSMLKVLGQQRTAGIEREKMDLAKEKFEYEKNPPMIQMKTESGQIYEVPKAAQAEGIRAKAEVEERYRTGKINQAQHDAWMKPVVMSIPDGAGGWLPYSVPSGMMQTTAAAIKNLQEVRVSGVEQRRTQEGISALGGQTIGDIENIPLATLAATMPGMLPSLASRPKAGAAGLKPEERRKLILDQENNAFKMIEEGGGTSEASISAYNDRSKTLEYPSMMFKYKEEVSWWPDVNELVELKLPVISGKQVTPADIESAAKSRGVSVRTILETIHKGQLEIAQSKR